MLVLLAQTPYPISAEWQNGMIGIGLIALLALNIWDRVKRKPPLEDTFEKKGVAADGDHRLEQELNRLDERTRTEINALDKRTQESVRAMNEIGERRAQANRDLIQEKIGSLERTLGDKINENRENNTGAFAKIEGRLDSFQVSMQGLSNDVMHQIGRLEGQMDGVRK
jgi:uncharacterized protein YllA (UPF0747 family)